MDSVVTSGGLILVAIITAFGGIQVALINTTRRHAKATKYQVENEHVNSKDKIPNIRENIDHNQSVVVSLLKSVLTKQARHDQYFDKVFAKLDEHEVEIDTLTRKKI